MRDNDSGAGWRMATILLGSMMTIMSGGTIAPGPAVPTLVFAAVAGSYKSGRTPAKR